MTASLYDFKVKNIEGLEKSLKDYEGKVLLVVNVASQCGFTPQYKQLEEIYKKYKDQGFEVLAFPCNQFKQQEPGNEADIKSFCEMNFGVSFPLFAKVDVNGKNEHPLFAQLKKDLPGILGTQMIKWNFTKFLIDRNGHPFSRYAPKDNPLDMSGDIEKLLKK
jgi:glutathione peroxidase